MVRKTLRKMECTLGFVQIPASGRSELIGNAQLPCSTKVNGCEAKIDKFGRLWCSVLKNNLSSGSIVELTKTDTGYVIFPVKTDGDIVPQDLDTRVENQKDKTMVMPSSLGKDLITSTLKPYFHFNSIDLRRYCNFGKLLRISYRVVCANYWKQRTFVSESAKEVIFSRYE